MCAARAPWSKCVHPRVLIAHIFEEVFLVESDLLLGWGAPILFSFVQNCRFQRGRLHVLCIGYEDRPFWIVICFPGVHEKLSLFLVEPCLLQVDVRGECPAYISQLIFLRLSLPARGEFWHASPFGRLLVEPLVQVGIVDQELGRWEHAGHQREMMPCAMPDVDHRIPCPSLPALMHGSQPLTQLK